MRVELHWQGETPRRWSGRVEFEAEFTGGPHERQPTDGLSGAINLTPGPLLVAGIFTSADVIEWGPPSRRPVLGASENRWVDVAQQTGGISFRVSGKSADRLRVRIDGRDQSPDPTIELTLQDLFDRPEVLTQWPGGWSVTLRRVRDQDLRLRLDDGQTVFSPGQTVRVDLAAVGLATGGTGATGGLPIADPDSDQPAWQLDWALRKATDRRPVTSGSWLIASPTGGVNEPLMWTVPDAEGAYLAEFWLRRIDDVRRTDGSSRGGDWAGGEWTKAVSRALQSGWAVLPLQESWNRLGTGGGSANRGKESEVRTTSFSIAIVASDADADTGATRSVARADGGSHWRSLGELAWSGPESAVSKVLPGPAAKWVVAATGGRSVRKVTIAGRKLVELKAGEQVWLPTPVQQVGRRHRALIRVPNGMAIDLAVQPLDVSPTNSPVASAGWGTARPLGPAAVILRHGYDDENTGWHVAVIDYWPRSKHTQLAITNRWSGRVARLGSIEILHDPSGDADQVADDSRWSLANISQSSESSTAGPEQSDLAIPAGSREASRLACLQLELVDLFDQFGPAGQPTLERPLDYDQVWLTAERLIGTMNREGFNTLILTVASDGQAIYPTQSWHVPAVWNANWRSEAGSVDAQELLLRMLGRAGLKCIPCVRTGAPDRQLEASIRAASPANSGIAMNSPLGNQLGPWSFDSPDMTLFGLYDPSHPEVTSRLAAMLQELHLRCGNHRSVHALGALADERSWLKVPPPEGLGPATLERFRTSLGQAAPPAAELSNYLRQVGYGPLERWLGERIGQGIHAGLDAIGDRPLWLLSTDNAVSAHLITASQHPRVMTARLQRRSLVESTAKRVRDEACSASVSVAGTTSPTPLNHDIAIFFQPISEIAFPVASPGADASAADALLSLGDDGRDASIRLTPRLDERESAFAMAQLLARSDRLAIVWGGGDANQPGGEARRRSLRRFTQLPPIRMEDVRATEPLPASIRLRKGEFNGQTYFCLTNVTRWPITANTVFAAPIVARSIESDLNSTTVSPAISAATASSDLQGNRQESAADRGPVDMGRTWRVDLAAGEWVAIRISGPSAAVVRCEAHFAEGHSPVVNLRQSIQHAVALANRTSSVRPIDGMINLGFEEVPPHGISPQGIPGWLVAQHPPQCVALDSSVSFEGQRSIRLSGQSEQGRGGWFVSPVVHPPASGRLAVSLRLRGEAARPPGRDDSATTDQPIRVRMALEGTIHGTPILQVRTVDVPRDGKWGQRPEILELPRLPVLPVESLRLTVDLVSSGVVWVDDVTFLQNFMTSPEKANWDQLVYVAVGGLSRGDLTGASRLFDSHWSVELVRPESDAVAMASHRNGHAHHEVGGATQVSPDVAATAYSPVKDTEGPVTKAAFSGGDVRNSGEDAASDASDPLPPQPAGRSIDGQNGNNLDRLDTLPPGAGMLHRLKSWLPKRVAF
ncbi:MAG: hypothetical protein EA381_03070 [Planctomycetaceae bacterium]|nr:MAG: hypothetical protein EA381_03070 [Planctomycetaceae bacterium]